MMITFSITLEISSIKWVEITIVNGFSAYFSINILFEVANIEKTD